MMNDLDEKAINYAEGKAKDALTSAIAQAYKDGYTAGWKESKEGVLLKPDMEAVEFIDLGLKSKTQWAKEYLVKKQNSDFSTIYLSYEDASKFSIPTEEQWLELIANCRWECKDISQVGGDGKLYLISRNFICTGKNGEFINFRTEGWFQGSNFHQNINLSTSWLFNMSKTKNNSFQITVDNTNNDREVSTKEVKTFTGNRFPVRVVRVM